MINILITGKNSFIGKSLKEYLSFDSNYTIEELDVRNDLWKEKDFSQYDIVFHVAGIVHIKETMENRDLYTKVNTDLTMEIAEYAKKSKVKLFIFMSTMSVYGLDCSRETISNLTALNPITTYGKSKLEAEHRLETLHDDNFKIAILRPPMVYGENAPGNMNHLLHMVRKLHIFPKFQNARSYITIENLMITLKDIIDYGKQGIFLPQNPSYLCTYEFIKGIMEKEGVTVIYVRMFNPLIRFCIGKIKLISKAFGDLCYERE